MNRLKRSRPSRLLIRLRSDALSWEQVVAPRSIWSGCLILACLLPGSPADAEQVAVHGPITRFSASELGGIRSVIRSEAIRPDRREIDYLLLADPADATSDGLPEQVQVVGPHGAQQPLADIDGSDCAFQRFVMVRSGMQVALITARRIEDPGASTGLSSPASIEIQTYRRQDGGDPGDSSPIFIADSNPHRTRPLCSAVDMGRAIDTVAATMFGAKGATP